VLIPWLKRNTFELINIPNVPTFYKANLVRASVINLAFVTINMREEVRDWKAFWDLQLKAEHVLIRFKIATRFTELIKNPLHTGLYNLEKADWPRFRNRFKQFITPVLVLYYSQNSWTNKEVNLLAKEMQLLLLLLLFFNKCM
jgi:hypothetical protein